MLRFWIGTGLLAGAALAAAPAFAQAPAAAAKTSQIASAATGGEVVPDVAPGDQIAIACAPIEYRRPDADVRVVLTISAKPDDTPTGYHKVLATDELLGKYGVRVRIPNVPDLPDHTVNLNVYVVNDGSSRGCDAGHVRVVSRGVPDFRRDAAKKPVT